MLRNALILVLLFFSISGFAQEKIKDFYLSNYKGDGSIDWEVRGEEALIRDKQVDIEHMDAKYYGDEDTISVQSKKAQLDKESMDVALRQDVHVENETGITLDTESLDWQKSQSRIETEDWVEIKKEDMKVKAQGLWADTALKKVDFKRRVEAEMPNEKDAQATTVTCDGPLEISYDQGRAVFHDNVIVKHPDGTLFSDKATVFFDAQGKSIVKIVSEGSVKIVKDQNVTFAQKASYFRNEGKVVLEGRPRLVYFPKNNDKSF